MDKQMMNNSFITKACLEDLEEILQLQYLAYQSDAALFGSYSEAYVRQQDNWLHTSMGN